jgi:hypothetical protein
MIEWTGLAMPFSGIPFCAKLVKAQATTRIREYIDRCIKSKIEILPGAFLEDDGFC